MSSRGAPGGLLLEPRFLGAVALLVLNDHVLKAAFPGLVTGKLSDFAGAFFFPILLVSVLELCRTSAAARRSLSLAVAGTVTAVVFALVKTWPPATHAFSLSLGGLQQLFRCAATWAEDCAAGEARVVRDAWDLVALPFCFGGALGERQAGRKRR